jgi:hypothetical protein
MGAANQNTYRSGSDVERPPTFFGEQVTRKVRPWSERRDALAASPKKDQGVNASEVLVTGGTGSLGRRVVDRLRGPGYEGRALSRNARSVGVAQSPQGLFCSPVNCSVATALTAATNAVGNSVIVA